MAEYGINVLGNYGFLPIDSAYRNFVLFNSGRTYVTSGVQTFNVSPSGQPGLQIAVKHPGITVALLGYLKNSQGVYGARVYVNGSGYINWKAFVEHYYLAETGVGMVVYDEKGNQAFHSNHDYFDVNYASTNVTGSNTIRDLYYFMVMPSTPAITYSSTSYATRGRAKTRRECKWVTSYEYQYVSRLECGYSTDMFGNSRYSCQNVGYWENVRVTDYVCEEVITGYEWHYSTTFYMTKKITGLYQDGSVLKPKTLTVNNETEIWGYGGITSIGSWGSSYTAPPGIYYTGDPNEGMQRANVHNAIIATR